MKSLSRVRLLATPWTVAYQAPPSMGFSRQAYWSGVPSPSPRKEQRESEIPVFSEVWGAAGWTRPAGQGAGVGMGLYQE